MNQGRRVQGLAGKSSTVDLRGSAGLPPGGTGHIVEGEGRRGVAPFPWGEGLRRDQQTGRSFVKRRGRQNEVVLSYLHRSSHHVAALPVGAHGDDELLSASRAERSVGSAHGHLGRFGDALTSFL